MWIFLAEAFLSIVASPEEPDSLKIRGRFKGDIERIFPEAQVEAWAGTDYAYRATLPRARVAEAVSRAATEIKAVNFKGSVPERWRHDTYMDVWSVLAKEQDRREGRPPRKR
jgi:hypothetical protein